jgi:hypothetical protein
LAGLLQGSGEEGVRFGTALVGRKIVGTVKIHGVHGLQRDKLADVDDVGMGVFEGLEFLGAEHDVLIFRELVALHHLRALDRFSVGDGDVLLLDPGAVFLAE